MVDNTFPVTHDDAPAGYDPEEDYDRFRFAFKDYIKDYVVDAFFL